MPGLITQEMKLRDVYPGLMKSIEGIGEDAVFIRKGLMSQDLIFDDGERSAVDYITTSAIDRDGEIVDPMGAILTDYQQNPVVLFGHDHWSMPIGKCAWIKADGKGLVAKTIYANTEKANEIWEYRKAGFPLAKSIGFIPLESIRFENNSPEYMAGCTRKFTKWLLLEYSEVPVPSNPEAVQIAISKGLMGKEQAIEGGYILADEPEEKEVLAPEEKEVNIEGIEKIDEGSMLLPIGKSGRILSAKTRAAMEAACDAMDAAGKACAEAKGALETLMMDSEPMEEPDEPMEPEMDGKAIEQDFIEFDDTPAIEKAIITAEEVAQAIKDVFSKGIIIDSLRPAIKQAAQDAVAIRKGRLN
ncbi:MAG: HK97 family phage prohead protease [Dehalococcoidales bacterium]|nr:HK97 family phage prohead protease [Dehalococcoidales bacterium]